MERLIIGNIFFILILLLILTSVVNAEALDKSSTNSKVSSRQHEVLQQPPPLNTISKNLQKAGVQDCLRQINQITDYFIKNNEKTGVAIAAAPENPNQHILSISLESQSAQQTTSFTDANFVTTGSGQCGSSIESVMYWQNSCAEVATQVFGKLENKGMVLKNVIALQGSGPELRVFLMPAEKNSCISIRKEMQF